MNKREGKLAMYGFEKFQCYRYEVVSSIFDSIDTKRQQHSRLSLSSFQIMNEIKSKEMFCVIPFSPSLLSFGSWF